MNTTDKIRAHFRKNPDADVAKAAHKFNTAKARIYKLRKEVMGEQASPVPEMVPTPEPVSLTDMSRKVTLSRFQVEVCKRLGVTLEDYVKEGLAQGTLQYDDEQDTLVVDETLDERAKDYGTFKDGAALMQGIKRLLADHAARHNKTFTDDQWEALEMIVHKMARIVNGNPDKVDSWVDIAGYATLVADRLQGNAR